METKASSIKWQRKAVAFLVSQAISLFGSSLVQMAIIWHVTLETSSGAWVTALTLSSLVPQIVISFFGGVWSDKYDRKKLIITADSAIAVATLLLALFLLTGKAGPSELIAIIAVSFIRSVGSGIHGPAVGAVIPDLVPEEQLIRFNGINSSVQSVIQFTNTGSGRGHHGGRADRLYPADRCVNGPDWDRHPSSYQNPPPPRHRPNRRQSHLHRYESGDRLRFWTQADRKVILDLRCIHLPQRSLRFPYHTNGSTDIWRELSLPFN